MCMECIHVWSVMTLSVITLCTLRIECYGTVYIVHNTVYLMHELLWHYIHCICSVVTLCTLGAINSPHFAFLPPHSIHLSIHPVWHKQQSNDTSSRTHSSVVYIGMSLGISFSPLAEQSTKVPSHEQPLGHALSIRHSPARRVRNSSTPATKTWWLYRTP